MNAAERKRWAMVPATPKPPETVVIFCCGPRAKGEATLAVRRGPGPYYFECVECLEPVRVVW